MTVLFCYRVLEWGQHLVNRGSVVSVSSSDCSVLLSSTRMGSTPSEPWKCCVGE